MFMKAFVTTLHRSGNSVQVTHNVAQYDNVHDAVDSLSAEYVLKAINRQLVQDARFAMYNKARKEDG